MILRQRSVAWDRWDPPQQSRFAWYRFCLGSLRSFLAGLLLVLKHLQ